MPRPVPGGRSLGSARPGPPARRRRVRRRRWRTGSTGRRSLAFRDTPPGPPLTSSCSGTRASESCSTPASATKERQPCWQCRFDRFGPPDVLEIGVAPDPVPAGDRYGSGSRRPVSRRSTWRCGRGRPRRSRNLALPHIPGVDAAGVVDEVGPDVVDVSVGDEVVRRRSPSPGSAGPPPSTRSSTSGAQASSRCPGTEAGGAGFGVETATRALDLLDVRDGMTVLGARRRGRGREHRRSVGRRAWCPGAGGGAGGEPSVPGVPRGSAGELRRNPARVSTGRSTSPEPARLTASSRSPAPRTTSSRWPTSTGRPKACVSPWGGRLGRPMAATVLVEVAALVERGALPCSRTRNLRAPGRGRGPCAGGAVSPAGEGDHRRNLGLLRPDPESRLKVGRDHGGSLVKDQSATLEIRGELHDGYGIVHVSGDFGTDRRVGARLHEADRRAGPA